MVKWGNCLFLDRIFQLTPCLSGLCMLINCIIIIQTINNSIRMLYIKSLPWREKKINLEGYLTSPDLGRAREHDKKLINAHHKKIRLYTLLRKKSCNSNLPSNWSHLTLEGCIKNKINVYQKKKKTLISYYFPWGVLLDAPPHLWRYVGTSTCRIGSSQLKSNESKLGKIMYNSENSNKSLLWKK